MALTIPQTILKQATLFSKNLISSKDLGFRLARIGAGATVIGAGAGTGLTLFSSGVNDAGKTTSEGFGIPKEILFILGAIVVILLLVGMKK